MAKFNKFVTAVTGKDADYWNLQTLLVGMRYHTTALENNLALSYKVDSFRDETCTTE